MKNAFVYQLLCALVFLASQSEAQIIAPSAQEVQYSYEATFEVPENEHVGDYDSAYFHATHLFGIFASPRLLNRYDLSPNLVGGIGAPRSQPMITIISSEVTDQNTVLITYKNTGRMILHKKVAARALETGVIHAPLPTNPFAIYNAKCTDEHYDTFGDYWYFYDPFRDGCQYLSKPPYAVNTEIVITPVKNEKLQKTPQLPSLRGDNGNGSLFSIYMIQGFSEDKSDPEDVGRLNYKDTNDFLISQGFSMEKIKAKTPYPHYRFTKPVKLSNGKTIQIQVDHLLVETAMQARTVVFAKFFKEAVEQADVIIYGGHSGLGGNLDIPSLEQKVGKFEFNHMKKQIFYFDSCSSYSYYLEHFAVEKTKAKIDIMTNGLSSYFDTSQLTVKIFLGYLFSKDNRDIQWSTILSNMESVLDKGKGSYLLNVGGI